MTLLDIDLETRAQVRDSMLRVRETRSVAMGDFELREAPNGTGGTVLNFEGYASVTESGYEMRDMFGPYTEVVRAGAFTKTLAEGADVAFLVNHEGISLARTKSGTMTLAEDSTGLLSAAQFDPASPAVQVLRSAIDRGDIDEMSFAFRVTRQQWSPDYEQRDITEVDINKGDVSAVNYGANPATGGTVSLRHQLPEDLTVRALAKLFTELRSGERTDESEAALSALLRLAPDADEAAVAAVVTDLLGQPEPEPEPVPVDDLALLRAKATLLSLSRR